MFLMLFIQIKHIFFLTNVFLSSKLITLAFDSIPIVNTLKYKRNLPSSINKYTFSTKVIGFIVLSSRKNV